MGWGEFRSLLGGISPDTVLGRVVAIRSETDPKIIKLFNSDQRRIYDAWRNRAASTMSLETYDQQMAYLENMMSALCGGGRH